MRRLIVAALFTAGLHAVLHIVHQRGQTDICICSCAPDAQLLIVFRAQDQLLTPVAEQINRDAWYIFGSVIRSAAACCEKTINFICTVHFGDCRAVKDLAFQITVPIDKEVLCRLGAADGFSVLIVNITVRSAPEFRAFAAQPHIISGAAAGILCTVDMEDDLTGFRIHAGFAVGFIFVANEELQTLPIRQQIAQMHGISVMLTGRPEEFTVIVDRRSAHKDLLLAVVIGISDHDIMVAAAPAGSILIESGVIDPALDQFAVPDIQSGEGQAGIIASAVDSRWMHAVQISDGAVHAVDAVAVFVAPIADRTARHRKIYGIECGTGSAVKE